MDLRVIYKARPESVSRIVGLLRKEGFSPTVLDHPDSTYAYASGWTNLIRIAVPHDQARQAKSILAKWEQSIEPAADQLNRRFRTQLFYSLLIVLVLGAILLACGVFSTELLLLLFFVWLAAFIIISNVPRISQIWRDLKKPL